MRFNLFFFVEHAEKAIFCLTKKNKLTGEIITVIPSYIRRITYIRKILSKRAAPK